MDIRKCAAEAIGTFWLTFAGCGSAVIAAGFPEVGIGLLGVSLAFGLTRADHGLCHRPHLRLPSQPGRHRRALRRAGASRARISCPYIVAQVIGAIVAAAVLYAIASGAPGFDLAKGFAANGYGEHSPGKYTLFSGADRRGRADHDVPVHHHGRDARQGSGRASRPSPSASALTLIHLVGIPVTNTSVNPARSTGPALFVGGWALAQLWLFWVAPHDRRRAGRHALSLAQRGALGQGDGHRPGRSGGVRSA